MMIRKTLSLSVWILVLLSSCNLEINDHPLDIMEPVILEIGMQNTIPDAYTVVTDQEKIDTISNYIMQRYNNFEFPFETRVKNITFYNEDSATALFQIEESEFEFDSRLSYKIKEGYIELYGRYSNRDTLKISGALNDFNKTSFDQLVIMYTKDDLSNLESPISFNLLPENIVDPFLRYIDFRGVYVRLRYERYD